MAKVDLKLEYRSVPISKQSQKVTGLRWQFGSQTVFLRELFWIKAGPQYFPPSYPSSEAYAQSSRAPGSGCLP